MSNNTLILSTGYGSMDLLNPTPDQVTIGDMLTNLSRIPRWCGAVGISVLQHQFEVARILERQGACRDAIVAGLTHDLHEYVTGDIPAPLLDALWFDTGDCLVRLADAQEGIQKAIDARLGIVDRRAHDAEVNAADLEAREDERAGRVPASTIPIFARIDYHQELLKHGVNI